MWSVFSYIDILIIGNLVRETTLANVVVLLVEFSPLILGVDFLEDLCILMAYPIQIPTIRMGLCNIYFKGSQVDIFKYFSL